MSDLHQPWMIPGTPYQTPLHVDALNKLGYKIQKESNLQSYCNYRDSYYYYSQGRHNCQSHHQLPHGKSLVLFPFCNGTFKPRSDHINHDPFTHPTPLICPSYKFSALDLGTLTSHLKIRNEPSRFRTAQLPPNNIPSHGS